MTDLSALRRLTRARVALGRAGDAQKSQDVLEFQLAHARARDAVYSVADFVAIRQSLSPHPCMEVESRARDRADYLKRPDLGRRLSDGSHARLTGGPWDIVFVLADGLSSIAVDGYGARTFHAAAKLLTDFRIGPVVLARQGRVAIGDEIGAALAARLVVVLLGERPGLSTCDSLGAYLTFDPRIGRRDSERNCISNIHADGLLPEVAAQKIAWLARQALRLGLTGVGLKENSGLLEQQSPMQIDKY
jgi:ethanolamine ammonia-lyase small subunit